MRHESCPRTPELIRVLRRTGDLTGMKEHIETCPLCQEACQIHYLLRECQTPPLPVMLRHAGKVRYYLLYRQREHIVQRSLIPLRFMIHTAIIIFVLFISGMYGFLMLKKYKQITAYFIHWFHDPSLMTGIMNIPIYLVGGGGLFLFIVILMISEYVMSS